MAPTPVGPPRSAWRALAAVLVMAAAIAVAVGLAQQPPPPSVSPVPPTPPTRPDAATSAVPTQTPTRAPTRAPTRVPTTPGPGAAGTPPRLARDVLRDRVVGGLIDEQLVLVGGVLRATPVRCQGSAQGTCDPVPRWRVVARFDPERSIRVLVP